MTGPAAAPPPEPPPTRAERWTLVAVALVGVAHHLRMMATLSSAHGEYFAIFRAPLLLGIGAPSTELATEIHGPLHAVIIYPWMLLGDLVGTRLGLLWVRLPNLALTVLAVVLLARLGRRVGAAWAGLAAGALYATLPLTMEMAITAQNYPVEIVCGLWFTERVAATARGLRSPRSLALAAACAVAAGYMNALVLLPGAVLVLALGARERAWRFLGESAAWAALFTLPVLPRALRAAAHYASLSLGAGQARDASLERAVNHPSFDISMSFGAGEVRVACERTLAMLLGDARWAAALGVALLYFRPAAGAYALALFGAFALANTRINMLLQNYGPVLPYVLLWVTAGAELLCAAALARSSLPPPARRRALAALLAALVAAVAVVGRDARAPGFTCRYLSDGSEVPLREVVAASPGLPILLYHRAHWDIPRHALCLGTPGVGAMLDCVMGRHGWNEDAGGWRLTRGAHGREIAQPRSSLVASEGCTPEMIGSVDGLARRPAWSRGFLVLRGQFTPVSEPSCLPLDVRFVGGCALVRRVALGSVYRCPPAPR